MTLLAAKRSLRCSVPSWPLAASKMLDTLQATRRIADCSAPARRSVPSWSGEHQGGIKQLQGDEWQARPNEYAEWPVRRQAAMRAQKASTVVIGHDYTKQPGESQTMIDLPTTHQLEGCCRTSRRARSGHIGRGGGRVVRGRERTGNHRGLVGRRIVRIAQSSQDLEE